MENTVGAHSQGGQETTKRIPESILFSMRAVRSVISRLLSWIRPVMASPARTRSVAVLAIAHTVNSAPRMDNRCRSN